MKTRRRETPFHCSTLAVLLGITFFWAGCPKKEKKPGTEDPFFGGPPPPLLPDPPPSATTSDSTSTSTVSGTASSSGGPAAQAGSVVAGMSAGFRRCYNEGLKTNPKMEGSIRIKARIGPNGE